MRRAATGIVPDMTDQGEGVRVGSVQPGSGADNAGLKAGDRLLGLGGVKTSNLRALADALKDLRPGQTVDVASIVDKAAAASGEKLEWRTSIVDLMKALKIDSSLAARKELAKELGYTGDTHDSATMNVWLHKQVMAKLAANGGKLPPEIKH